MKTKIVLLLAALSAASLAQAQSHSVANYSNPPNVQADSKAGTKATPGKTATTEKNSVNEEEKSSKDAAANKSKPKKSAAAAQKSAQAAGSSGSAGKSGSGGGTSASNIASKHKSQSASASVHLDGASKGGAEATMQNNEPSQSNVNPTEQHAFDSAPTPAGSKSGGK